jgi:hypothetical protein
MVSMRQQMVDCLKWLRRNPSNFVSKRSIEESYQTEYYDAVSLQAIADEHSTVDPSLVIISGHSVKDYDGYPEGRVAISYAQPETDSEYYDTIASCMCDEFILSDYKKFLELKKRFEGT